jgi:uncharacterized protein YraI
MSRWVSTEIVTADTAQHRAMLIKRFVLIASVCYITFIQTYFHHHPLLYRLVYN